MAEESRFDIFLKAAAERKKPRRDFKEVMREFVEYRNAPDVEPKSEKSEKPKKPGKPENLKQPEEDFLK